MGNFRKSVIKPFNLTIGLIGLAVSVVAIVDLIKYGMNYTFADWLNEFLKTYRYYSEYVWKFLDPLAKQMYQYLNSIIEILRIELDLNSWWKSFWTPQFFYAIAVANSAWTKHRSRWFQIFCFSVGLPIFFASSVAASSWSLESDSIWPMMIIGVGFTVFHLFVDLWYAYFVAHPNERWASFRRLVIAYPLGNLGIVLVIAIVSVLVLRPNGITLPVVAQILLAVALMGARDVAGGMYGATFERSPGRSWLEAFFGYATTTHGLYVLAALSAAAVTIVLAVQPAAHSLQ